MAVLLCKWNSRLATALLDLAPDLYIILDDFDVENMRPDPAVLARMRQVYRVSHFDSIEELAGIAVDLELREAGPVKIVSHTEFSQYGAGYLDLLLRNVHDPMRHVAFRDKRLMKRRVAQAGAQTTRFASVPGAEHVAAAAELTFPVVVKPSSGFGTMSTLRVETYEELAKVVSEYSFEPLLRGKHLIVEEFVDGAEYGVDSIWADGQALTFVVHEYYVSRLDMTHRTESWVPLDGSRIVSEKDEPDLYRRLRKLHEHVNRGLDIRDGATHLELFVRPDGDAVFSEIATRVGGAWIPRMLGAHFGRPVWDSIADAAVTGRCPEPRPPYPYVGGLHLSPMRPGIITALPSEAELAAHPGVLDWQCLRRVGGTARLAHPSDWYFFVTVGAETREAYDQLCREVVERFRIDTQEHA